MAATTINKKDLQWQNFRSGSSWEEAASDNSSGHHTIGQETSSGNKIYRIERCKFTVPADRKKGATKVTFTASGFNRMGGSANVKVFMRVRSTATAHVANKRATEQGLDDGYPSQILSGSAIEGVTWTQTGLKLAPGQTYYLYLVPDNTSKGYYSFYQSMVKSLTLDGDVSYSISYNANSGSNPPSNQSKDYGSSIKLRTGKPTRDGYTFVSWNTKADGSGTTYAPGATYTTNSNLTLYAQWQQNVMNISYFVGGAGASVNSTYAIYGDSYITKDGNDVIQTIKYGQNLTVKKPSDFGLTKPGHKFSHWIVFHTEGANEGIVTSTGATLTPGQSYSYTNFTDRYKKHTVKTGSGGCAISAEWTQNKITVNLYGNGATSATNKGVSLPDPANLLGTQTFAYNTTYSSGLANIQNPDALYVTKTGYHPTGVWQATAIGGVTIDQDLSLTGKSLAQALGKNLDNGDLTQNLYVQWAPNEDTPYTVEYWIENLNNTDYQKHSAETRYGTSDTTSAPIIPKTIVGFNTPIRQTVYIKPDGSAVLKYYYTRKSYSVSLLAGTGISSVSGAGSYKHGATVTINAVVRPGYTWSQWTSGSTATKTQSYSFTLTQSKTYTANATANTYYVKYNGNGATSGSMANSTHTYDVPKELTENAYQKKYTVKFNANNGEVLLISKFAIGSFSGWASSSSGTKKYNDKASVTNLTSTNKAIVNLYAKWTNGSVTAPTAQQFTKTGYTLRGFGESATSNTIVVKPGASYTPSSNKDLYGIWLADTDIPYEVEYWYQNIDGNAAVHNSVNYTKKTTVSYTGTADTSVTPVIPESPGFTTPPPQEKIIKADGSTVFKYYYTRNKYYINIYPNGGSWQSSTGTSQLNLFYNDKRTLEIPTRPGYLFCGWYKTAYGALDQTATKSPLFTVTAELPRVYNNSGDGSVTHSCSAGTDGGYQRIITITTTGNTAKPERGGFITYMTSEQDKEYIHVFRAKAPTGTSLKVYHNLGTQGSVQWLTDNKGTGEWEDYAYKMISRVAGKTFGHVALKGGPASGVTWYLTGSQITESPDTTVQQFTVGAGNTNLYAQWIPWGSVKIYVDSVWKMALPYVYMNGAWQRALPYVNENGTPTGWKMCGG